MSKFTKIDNKVSQPTNMILHLIFILMATACLYPVLLVLGVSFSSTKSLVENGFMLIPAEFSMSAYQFIFASSKQIVNAYMVTIMVTVVGACLSVLVVSLYAYPISRPDFRFKKFFTFFIFVTMLFGGGLVPWYILMGTVGLKDNFWALCLPMLMSSWYTIIMRTFFSTTIPQSLIESAKIDGASEFRIFFQMVLPLSLPGLATIGLFATLGYWNDWYLCMMLIEDRNWYNLQFLLQSMMKNIQQLTDNATRAGGGVLDEQLANLPDDAARMALCMIALGPIVIVYPFFQKYFVQGLTVGAIKG